METLAASGPSKAGRGHEAPAILLLCATALLLLSMISYLRPLFGAEPQLQAPNRNWCGALGFYTAHYLFSFLGLVAALPLGLLALRAVRVILGRESERRLPLVLAGMSGIALAASGLCGAFGQLWLPAAYVRPGGWLGALVWPLCNALVGRVGSVIALLVLGLLSVMVVVPFSPAALLKAARERARRAPVRKPARRARPARALRDDDEDEEDERPVRPGRGQAAQAPEGPRTASRLFEDEPARRPEPRPERPPLRVVGPRPVLMPTPPEEPEDDELQLEMERPQPVAPREIPRPPEPASPQAWEEEDAAEEAAAAEDELHLDEEDLQFEIEAAPQPAPARPIPPASSYFEDDDDEDEPAPSPRRPAGWYEGIEDLDEEEETRPARPAPAAPTPQPWNWNGQAEDDEDDELQLEIEQPSAPPPRRPAPYFVDIAEAEEAAPAAPAAPAPRPASNESPDDELRLDEDELRLEEDELRLEDHDLQIESVPPPEPAWQSPTGRPAPYFAEAEDDDEDEEPPAPRRPVSPYFPYGDGVAERPQRLADRFMDPRRDPQGLEVEDEDEEEPEYITPAPARPAAAPAPLPPRPPERPVRPEPPPPPPPKPVNHWEDYVLPSLDLLASNPQADQPLDEEHYYTVSNILVDKLQAFGVQGSVVGISPGPVVTTYEFSPAPGVKISRVVALADDLAMVLKVDRVRVVGSIPGKVAIGIEIPNPVRSTVYLKDILLSDEFRESRSKLTLALGFDVVGRPAVANLAKMPHLLIAGATGAGKSVAINAFIASILFRATPAEVRLLMIDPKRIELSVYDDIPHLLHPVVVEAKQASRALLWAVHEMERRYRLLEQHRVKSFMSYNEIADEPLPYIVVIVDELADLMMVASKDVETSIARLAQMARAAGMHIILATQRPSVDVLTGLIKANFPTRISFKVSSKVDSRTILDGVGAEHLLGMGDMLFLPPGAAKLQRIHGAFISEQETERLVEYLKTQGLAEYDESVLQEMEDEPEAAAAAPEEDEYDAKYDEAVAVVTETGVASISMVQRRLRVGYNRAARMIELMEREGIVGPADGSKPREVLVRSGYEDE